MKCPSCGADSNNRFCPYCGCEMPRRENGRVSIDDHSHNSHNQVINNYYYTNYESAPGYNPYEGPMRRGYEENYYRSGKSRVLAWIICFFFGYFGGHYFYVGRAGMGILYLFTVGIGGIGWIYDLYRIAVGDFRDSAGDRLR